MGIWQVYGWSKKWSCKIELCRVYAYSAKAAAEKGKEEFIADKRFSPYDETARLEDGVLKVYQEGVLSEEYTNVFAKRIGYAEF